MRLIGSKPSPFVRKVRVVANELGIGELEFEEVDVFDAGNGLEMHNPLRKIPALVLSDGRSLYDSAVICEWLCTTNPVPELLPGGEARWPVLVTQALADGLVDAAALARQERQRPRSLQSQAFIDRQLGAVERALSALNGDDAWRTRPMDLGAIAVACALGWLSFRFPDLDWPASFPDLSAWRDGFERRPSMKATAPGP